MVIYKEDVFDKNFFTKFQDFSLIVASLNMFDELEPIYNKGIDQIIVEFDPDAKLHLVEHHRNYYKKDIVEKRPICYLDKDNFSMKQVHFGFIQALREAWVEELI